MALVGLEWLIAAMVVVSFLWVPKKLPEIARAINEAKREWRKAERE